MIFAISICFLGSSRKAEYVHQQKTRTARAGLINLRYSFISDTFVINEVANVKITGHMAGLRGSESERGWQLESLLAECKELSGGEDTAK